MASWVIGYGIVQASAPKLLRKKETIAQSAQSALIWGFILLIVSCLLALGVQNNFHLAPTILGGLLIFGIVFAMNSALHSYLILAYSDSDKAALNVGFYYMANAGGRLIGTLLSGLSYVWAGLPACLWVSSACVFLALICTLALPRKEPQS